MLNFNNKKICVIGDAMLDISIYCTPRKISAEAPVLIINKNQTTMTLGGAANVALNLKTLGCDPYLITLAGKDKTKELILEKCSDNKIHIECFVREGVVTPSKTRVLADNQQIVRIDEEKIGIKGMIMTTASLGFEEDIFSSDGIILSDYGKGTLYSKNFCQEIIEKARIKKIPVFVDPVRKDWDKYHGAFCISPNLLELEEYSGINTYNNHSTIEMIARELIRDHDFTAMIVTLGKNGACLILKTHREPLFISAKTQDVFDVCGAGDTLIATLAASYATTTRLDKSLQYANIAAGIVVRKHGTATVTIQELERELNG